MFAPLDVKVAVPPTQIAEEADAAVIVGIEFTVTLTVCVFVIPAVFAPVTVYIVVTDGVTIIVDPLEFPGFQV